MSAPRFTTRNCAVCDKRLTKANADPYQHESLCNHCFEIAGIENEHQDGYHQDEPNEMCPMCGAEDAPATHSWSSHANCDHDKTKSARAKCRKARAAAE